MAIQFVGAATGSTAGATSGTWSVSLTALTGGIASSAAIGDVVVTVVATASSSVISQVNDAGYTQVIFQSSTGSTYGSYIEVSYKRLTETTTAVTFTATTNAKVAAAASVMVFRGVDTTSPMDVTRTVATGTASGRPNPPAITPVSSGAVIVACGSATAATGLAFTSSDLSGFASTFGVDTSDAMVGAGYYAWTSGSFDPAAWDGGTTGTGDAWVGVTIALRPLPPPNINFPALGGSFTRTGFQASFLLKPYKIAADSKALTYTGQPTAFSIAVLPKFITTSPLSSFYNVKEITLSRNGRTLVLYDGFYFLFYRRIINTWTFEYKIIANGETLEYKPVSYDGNVLARISGTSIGKYVRQNDGTWALTSTTVATSWDSKCATDYDGNRVLVTTASPPLVALYEWNGSTLTKLGEATPSLSVSGVTFGIQKFLSNDGNRGYVFDATTGSGNLRIYEFTYSGGSLTETLVYTYSNTDGYGWYGGDVLDDGSRVVAVSQANAYKFAVFVKNGSTFDSPLIYANNDAQWPFGAMFNDDGSYLWTTESDYSRVTKWAWNGTGYTFSAYLTAGITYSATQFPQLVHVGCNGNVVASCAPLYDDPGLANCGAAVLFVKAEPVMFGFGASFVISGSPAGFILQTLNENFPADMQALVLTAPDVALTKTSAQQKVISAASGSFAITGRNIASNAYIYAGSFSVVGKPANLKYLLASLDPFSVTVVGRAATVGVYAPALIDQTYISTLPAEFTNYQYASLSPSGGRLFAKEGPYTSDNPINVYTHANRVFTFEKAISNPLSSIGASAEFGWRHCAISADETHALIPATGDTTNSLGGQMKIGSVYYYTRSGSNWTQQQKIQPSQLFNNQSSSQFGYTISMSNDALKAIVAAPYMYDAVTYGGGGLFLLTRSGSTWTSTVLDYTGYGYSWLGAYSAISGDGSTVVYNYSRTSFKVKKYNGSSWPVVATFILATGQNVIHLAISDAADSILCVTNNGSTTTMLTYKLVSGTWLSGVTANLPVSATFDELTIVSSNTSLHYWTIQGSDYVYHLHTARPQDAAYTSITSPFYNLLDYHDGTSDHSMLVYRQIDSSTYGLRFYWRIPNINFACTRAVFTIGKPQATFTRTMRAAAGSFALNGIAAGLPRGPMFNAATFSKSMTGIAAGLYRNRKVLSAAGAFSVSYSSAAMLRNKGTINSVPAVFSVTGAPAKIVRSIPLQAGYGQFVTAAPASQVARIFTMKAMAGSYTYTLSPTASTLVIFLGSGAFASTIIPANGIHFRKLKADPGAFELSITRAAMRFPHYSGLHTDSANDAVAVTTEKDRVYA